MVRLRKLLADSSKSRRHRRNLINIQITILSWLIEFFGFLTIFGGSFIIGHKNSVVTLSLQTLTNVVYFIILPSLILFNDSNFKTNVAESRWYSTFLNIFNWQYIHQNDADDDNEDVNVQIVEEDGNENVNIPIDEDDDNDDVNNQIAKEGNNETTNNRTDEDNDRTKK